jgi:hypothetical protein
MPHTARIAVSKTERTCREKENARLAGRLFFEDVALNRRFCPIERGFSGYAVSMNAKVVYSSLPSRFNYSA